MTIFFSLDLNQLFLHLAFEHLGPTFIYKLLSPTFPRSPFVITFSILLPIFVFLPSSSAYSLSYSVQPACVDFNQNIKILKKTTTTNK